MVLPIRICYVKTLRGGLGLRVSTGRSCMIPPDFTVRTGTVRETRSLSPPFVCFVVVVVATHSTTTFHFSWERRFLIPCMENRRSVPLSLARLHEEARVTSFSFSMGVRVSPRFCRSSRRSWISSGEIDGRWVSGAWTIWSINSLASAWSLIPLLRNWFLV